MNSFCLFLIFIIIISSNCQTQSPNQLPFLYQIKSSNHVADSITRLAFAFINSAGDSNVIFSPVSLQSVLSIVLLGARGESHRQILNIFGYRRRAASDYHALLRQTIETLTTQDELTSITSDIVNAVLIQSGFNVSENYANNLHKYYKTDLNEVDFEQHPEIVFQWVNNWANFKTRSKIQKILNQPPSPSTLMMMINMAYFKGTWKYQFDETFTRPSHFYLNYAHKKSTVVPFMIQTTMVKFVEKPDLKAVELPYSGDKMAMLLLLPKAKDNVIQLQRTLTLTRLKGIINEMREKKVTIELPRFKLEALYDLTQILPELGIVDIFDQLKANLTRVEPSGSLFVNQAIHKATIDVNEEGTEASAVGLISAATRIGASDISYFTADHPFIFIIRDVKSGVIFFMGRVSEL